MVNTVLIDAGPLIALFDRDDKYHRAIVEFIKNTDYRFISTTAVTDGIGGFLADDDAVHIYD